MAIFKIYTPLLLNVEGGYQNLSNDSGNYNSLGQLVGTNYGISAKVYELWIKRPPSIADMKAITKTLSLQIYKIWFWDKIKGDLINNQSVANIIADHAVNAGVNGSGKLTQRVLNDNFGFNLIVDGIIGNKTISAINSVDAEKLHSYLKKAREEFYINLGGDFLKGWLYRLKKFVFSEKKKHCSACGQLLP